METLLDLKVTYPTDKFKCIEAGIKRMGIVGYALSLFKFADEMSVEFDGHPVGEECRLVREQFRKEFPPKRLIWFRPPFGHSKHDQELKRQMVDEGATMVLAAVCEAGRRHFDQNRAKSAVGTDAFIGHLEKILHRLVEDRGDQA